MADKRYRRGNLLFPCKVLDLKSSIPHSKANFEEGLKRNTRHDLQVCHIQKSIATHKTHTWYLVCTSIATLEEWRFRRLWV